MKGVTQTDGMESGSVNQSDNNRNETSVVEECGIDT